MITFYKKIEKSKENPSGIIEIEEITRPFLLCISAQDNYDKSIYGTIREGAQAARILTTNEIATGYKIDELPLDFLGLRFKKDDNYNNNYKEIVDKFIFPFLISSGINQVSEIKKKSRKINFMTYCDGTKTYEGIEKYLEEKLKNIGISQEDINDIISQISLVAIGTTVDTSKFKATTATFIDVNDDEIETIKTSHYQKTLTNNKRKHVYTQIKNNILYIYQGTGDHNLKKYLSNDQIVKPALCSVVSYFLENSIINEKNIELDPILPKDILNVLDTYTNEDKEIKKLLNELDNKINYGNTKKYTNTEAEIRQEIDFLYKEFIKKTLQKERIEKEIKETLIKITNITNQVLKCSDNPMLLKKIDISKISENNNIDETKTLNTSNIKSNYSISIKDELEFLNDELKKIINELKNIENIKQMYTTKLKTLIDEIMKLDKSIAYSIFSSAGMLQYAALIKQNENFSSNKLR